ncbi:acetyl-CoA C-acyltransferase [Schleiferiaceae bacterium]|jgi:acetyl-CoA C-acetyltransferase|nr:acetyl-CoA C-acyltransferase [Bacteroidota bacterium]MDA9147758.1 acetyl-CoA C-acyltransferase [Schleiferiaceae bacterium]HAR22412.1 acetyl-CoA C-acetyltransferase [Cryomorphaceae bacterium]MDA9192455.1 acetyl-CoA C-acyltransferase [Schleiferiaceae bacterium]MDA9199065.1 acetyl-CoA C-acyltransferase [Schleiferiaceae bacterium]
MKEVVIVSAVRTPMGSFGGALSSVPATALGAAAIKGALEKAGLSADAVEEVYMGNVLQANVGQAPARQAAMAAGIGNQVPCTTINKVCSSGMKAIMMGAQAIKAGDVEIIVAGGMENMSAVPHYLPTGRTGVKLGDISLVDGLVKDGLTDVYNAQHMGVCAELCAEEHQFTREDQDAFALESYRRSAAAWDGGKFANEVVPVAVPQRRGDAIVVDTDEEYTKVNTDKVPQLRPVFKKDGTVTAANASTLNDGASAVVLMSASKAAELGLDPIARITGYADAAQEPEWFTTAPAKALPKALAKAGITMDTVDFFEFNEAFSVVGLANMKLLGLDAAKVNVHGGAVSLGHPLGASGARIITTLIGVLQQNGGKIGAAAICNGGGGASALVLELM